MKVVRHTPVAFLDRARVFLEQREAEHNLILGLAVSLGEGTMTLSAPPVLATVEHDGEVVLAALRTPPHNLVLSQGPEDAVALLADTLKRDGVGLPGVTGPSAAAEVFARSWAGEQRQLKMSMRLYACSSALAAGSAAGTLRGALPSDADTLLSWARGFGNDIREPMTHAAAERWVQQRFDTGSLYVWDDGGPVCMAGIAAPSRHTVRVNAVYTPPERRGRGYATSCVHEVTRLLLLEHGTCVLYTDLENPTSNAIYQRIGYRPVSDNAMWSFDPATGAS